LSLLTEQQAAECHAYGNPDTDDFRYLIYNGLLRSEDVLTATAHARCGHGYSLMFLKDAGQALALCRHDAYPP
jgi:hypothetical protein